MKIHLLSDAHIEHVLDGIDVSSIIPMPAVTGGVCVLAGDIGAAKRPDQYAEYLTRLKDQFDHVILVLGNHEFYRMDYFKTLEVMKTIADNTGVILMDVEFGTENATIDGINFFGSTLWIDFNKNDPFVKPRVARSINDFRVITNFNTEKALEVHRRTIKKINWNADVVITHHMPILREHSKFPIDAVTYGFCCTDLERKIMQSKIKFWLYGHTHDSASYEIGKTQIVSNQMGYHTEILTIAYNPTLTIEV